MKIEGKVATWLDTVAATHARHAPVDARLHPVKSEETCSADPERQCYVISVNGRWLCSGNGRVTIVRGLAAAHRFLDLLKVEHFEAGEPAEFEIACNTNAHCMALDKRRGLRTCTQLVVEHSM